MEVESTSPDSSNTLVAKQRRVDQWGETAQREVERLAADTQRSIRNNLVDRIENIERKTKRLAPSPVQEAIDKGSQAGEKSEADKIDKDLSRFGNFGDDDD